MSTAIGDSYQLASSNEKEDNVPQPLRILINSEVLMIKRTMAINVSTAIETCGHCNYEQDNVLAANVDSNQVPSYHDQRDNIQTAIEDSYQRVHSNNQNGNVRTAIENCNQYSLSNYQEDNFLTVTEVCNQLVSSNEQKDNASIAIENSDQHAGSNDQGKMSHQPREM